MATNEKPTLPPPDGFIVVTDDSGGLVGDFVWSLYSQRWVPIPKAFIGRRTMSFYGLARKQEKS